MVAFYTPRLSPLKRSPTRRQVVAFDTEGSGAPGCFICGAVVCDSGDYIFRDPRAMLSFLTSARHAGAWLFAHNLEYDLCVLTGGNLTAFSTLFLHSRLLWSETADGNKHVWRFCDSGNLFPGLSVAALGTMVGLEKLSAPERLEVIAQDAAAISQLTSSERTEIERYCLRDAQIVFAAVHALQETLHSLGGQLASTIAGCAMDLFRRRYMNEAWPALHPAVNNIARAAYYGGRVEPYQLGRLCALNGYDVNSLYPRAQVDVDLPHPAGLTFEMSPPSRFQILAHPGWSYCTVEVPPMDVPPLPVRSARSLYFPTGTISGAWCHNELRHALECGVRLRDVAWSWYSTRALRPFDAYVNDLYALKSQASDRDPARRLVYKLLLNSLYGRWGIAGGDSLTALVPITSTEQLMELEAAEVRMIGDWPYALVPACEGRQPVYCFVPFAAHITAQARVHMHAHLAQCGSSLAYTDTDSLWTPERLPLSDQLGGLRQTHDGVDLWVVAPKEYAIFAGDTLLFAHAKGVPESLRLLYLRAGEVRFDAPVGIREAANRGLTPATWVERLKRRGYVTPKRAPLSPLSPDQEWTGTRAWSSQELAELLHSELQEPALPPTRLGQRPPD